MILDGQYPCSKKWNSPDSEANYKPINSGKLNYSKDEIEYKFNSHGYRCEEFNLESELPILFMGCSLTEGEGLPLNEVWTHHLHNKIKNITGKRIPFWSLGKGGTSIDYAARCLYELGPYIAPKYIFYLMSGISRREYCFETNAYQHWFPRHSLLYKPTESFKAMSNVFSDEEFAFYQTHRSTMILNSVATLLGSRIFIFDLNMDIVIREDKKISFFEKYDKITYFSIPSYDWNLLEAFFPNIIIPDHIKCRPEKARDNSHPGAIWQYKLYDWIWNKISNEIDFS